MGHRTTRTCKYFNAICVSPLGTVFFFCCLNTLPHVLRYPAAGRRRCRNGLKLATSKGGSQGRLTDVHPKAKSDGSCGKKPWSAVRTGATNGEARGPGCVQPVVGVVTGEKGKKVWIDTRSLWEGSWEACKLKIDRTVCAVYTPLTALREEWLGWDCQWCDSTQTQGDSPPSPLRRERSVAFESP